MSDETILDDEFILFKNESFYHIVKWWEQRRLVYCILVLSTEIVMTLLYLEGTWRFGIPDAILNSIAYTFVANLLYSGGWGVEIWFSYYLKTTTFFEKFRWFLFWAGTLFSVCLTVLLFHWSLY